MLSATDLDELLSAARALGEQSDEDHAVVQTVLSEDSDEQAIANVLFHPYLLPRRSRLTALTAALAADARPYRTLAAVVGLQGVDFSANTDGRAEVVQLLLDVLARTDDVRAARASVTITSLATVDDAHRLLLHVDHSNQAASHNVTAWFLTTFNSAEVIRAELQDCPARTRLLARVADHQALIANGASSSLTTTLFSYVPNLHPSHR